MTERTTTNNKNYMSIAVSVLTTGRVARNPDGHRCGSTGKQPAVGNCI